MGDDGHDSRCTYKKCAHPEATEPCPFLMEPKPIDKPKLMALAERINHHEVEHKAAMLDELADLLKRILEHD